MTNIYSYLDGVADGLKESRNDVIEELEKIKAEIEELEYYDFDCNLVLPAWKVYDIIYNHIEELKGDDK